MRDSLRDASTRLDAWIEQQDFQGWDPFDALNSPLIKRLTFGNRRLAQAWVQLLKNLPINIRPLLGISKGCNPKAMGLFLASYWRKYLLDRQPDDLKRVRAFADWLQAHVSKGYSGACWGYNFDWPNRAFFAPAGTPTIVNTAFNALALLDLAALPDPSGSVVWGQHPLQLARSSCEFVLRDLATNCPNQGERCFSYTPLDHRCVHNANVLGACLLAEVGSRNSEPQLIQAAIESARYTARRQQSDGSWPYGASSTDNWVDNFHTGYVLVALKRIADRLQVCEFDSTIRQGYHFWKKTFFLAEGQPKYYADRLYPVDTHCVAQGILTFLSFTDCDPLALEWAERVAGWGVDHLQAQEGYFHYQIRRGCRIRIPYMRWTQAWMQRGLAELLLAHEGRNHFAHS